MKTIRTERYEEVTRCVQENGGHCPCIIVKIPETKCPCEEFREQDTEGECRCGRFAKVAE